MVKWGSKRPKITKSNEVKPKEVKPKEVKPPLVSKIVIIKIGDMHIKILQRGDKAVVRKSGEILFNNLQNKLNFDKWWENTVEILGKNSTIDVIKSEVVDNKAMKVIHKKYGG